MGVLISSPSTPVDRPERPTSKFRINRRFLIFIAVATIMFLSCLIPLAIIEVFLRYDKSSHHTHKGNKGDATTLARRTTPTEPATPTATPTATPSGAPLFDLPRSHLGDVPYGVPIFTCATEGQIALTFNDGPSEYTEAILDALDHYNFKGTFFMTGSNATRAAARHGLIDDQDSGWPDLLSRIHETGHQIGSHTYTRARLDSIGAQDLVNEMVYNEMAFRNAFSLVPMYMRPPFGVWRDPAVREQLEGLGYHVILYDVDTRDDEHAGPDDIKKSIDIFDQAVRHDGNGAYIVQMHDVGSSTAFKLVPAILEMMVERGYKGVTVGECLDDEFYYWYRQPEP